MKSFRNIAVINLTLILQAIMLPVAAQSGDKLSCLSFVKKDSIILRWAPSSVPVWQAGSKYGYTIRRYTIAKDGIFIEDGLRNGITLTDFPVKPGSEDYFNSLSLELKEASIVQEAIYGGALQNVAGNSSDFGAFLKTYEEAEVKMGFALFICDLYPSLAKAAGLQFVDHAVVPGERYAYSVIPAFVPEGMDIEPATAVADAGNITMLPSVIDVNALFNDRIVRLRWPVIHLEGIYSAYLPEKSFDGKIFKPVSDLPLVNLSADESQEYFIFTDSLENNETRVWYRVTGISPFGEKGPPSEPVSGKGIPDFSAYASIDTAYVDSKKIILKWRVSENPDSPVRGISVLRSDNSSGPFLPVNSKMLSSRERSFTDNNPVLSNYYQVMLQGQGNLRSFSFPYLVQTEDNIPPLAPEILSGNVDSAGLVTILWKKNTEPDLLGYKVFRANSSSEEFIALEQGIAPENICHDLINLNTLSAKICYQVVAVDKNYNSSEYSRTLVLSLPDTVAPSPATITRISGSVGKVSISLEESSSLDVDFYDLFRLAEGDSVPEKIGSWPKTLPTEYEDIPDIREEYAEYLLVTVDKSGNRSQNSRKVFVRNENTGNIKLTALQSPDGRSITLKWEIPAGFIPVKTIIYRGEDSGPVTLYRTIPGSDALFNDAEIQINSSYSYRIMVFTGDNLIIRSQNLNFKPAAN